MSKTIYVCYEDGTPGPDELFRSGYTMILRKAFTNRDDAENIVKKKKRKEEWITTSKN